jgi:SEFIR domain-containing protein
MTLNATHPPTVFISYSHDSPEHADRVLALSDHLRADGIDCILDQYEDSPAEGFPRWMDRHIRTADFVLMICTRTYARRVMGEEDPGKGHGVAWERTLIYQYIYKEGTSNTRFLPVLLEGASEADIPVLWQGVKHYRPATQQGYEALYRRLTGQQFTPKPALGTLRTLPPRERKQQIFEQQPAQGSLDVIDNVPYARNPYFTGRDTILQNLHNALNTDSATVITQGHAISGLGGIGKTQTAVEYTYRYRSEYHFIFWVRAGTEVTLQAGFVDIARLLDLPEKDAPILATRPRQSSTGWNATNSGYSSSTMPMLPNCSPPTTRVHPQATSCLPREHSSSTRSALPDHLPCRGWIQTKRWTFSSNAQPENRATRKKRLLPSILPLSSATYL